MLEQIFEITIQASSLKTSTSVYYKPEEALIEFNTQEPYFVHVKDGKATGIYGEFWKHQNRLKKELPFSVSNVLYSLGLVYSVEPGDPLGARHNYPTYISSVNGRQVWRTSSNGFLELEGLGHRVVYTDGEWVAPLRTVSRVLGL